MAPYGFQYERLQRIFIVVTDACNGRCKLCNYWKTSPGNEKYLSLSFIKSEVIPIIKQYQIEAVCITGGEPTLNPELPQILETINRSGAIITVVTNGSRLDRVFDRVKYHVHAWLFSLDADNQALHRQTRGLDNFAELMAWPGKIKAAYPPAQNAFNCLIQKQNVRNLVDIYRLVCGLPCDGLFFNVPDLQPHSFGRNGRAVSPESMDKYVILTDEEIEILRGSLAEIRELDAGRERGKLLQGEEFFQGCIHYFEFLQGKEVTFKDNKRPCRVPVTSLVVDETGRFFPCFYLPPDFGDLPPDQREEIKDKYCRRCFQLQG